jgi:hypothetical protein
VRRQTVWPAALPIDDYRRGLDDRVQDVVDVDRGVDRFDLLSVLVPIQALAVGEHTDVLRKFL